MPPAILSFQELLAQLRASKQPTDQAYAQALDGYLKSGGSSMAGAQAMCFHPALARMAKVVGEAPWPWPSEYLRAAEFFASAFRARVANNQHLYNEPYPELLGAVLRGEPERGCEAGDWLWRQSEADGADPVVRLKAIAYVPNHSAFGRDATQPGESAVLSSWERRFLEMSDEALISLLSVDPSEALIQALLKDRRGLVRSWIEDRVQQGTLGQMNSGCIRLLVSDDGAFLDSVEAYLRTGASPSYRASVMMQAAFSANAEFVALFQRYAATPSLVFEPGVLDRMCELAPETARDIALQALEQGPSVNGYAATFALTNVLSYAAKQLGEADGRLFDRVEALAFPDLTVSAISALVLNHGLAGKPDEVGTRVRRLFATLTDAEKKLRALEKMAVHAAKLFFDEWVESLGSSSKSVRENAAEALTEAHRERCLELGKTRLRAKQADSRLGAVGLLGLLGSEEALSELKAAYATEKSKAVRNEIAAVLHERGAAPAAVAALPSGGDVWADLEARAAKTTRKPQLKNVWLDVQVLPELFTRSGRRVEAGVIAELLAIQAGHKPVVVRPRFVIIERPDEIIVDASAPPAASPALGPAPEIAPLFLQIDRARSGDFALALLEAWLASAQDAKDRWALVFVGALGDTRVLSVLNSWIPKWCEKGRGKLAEYAAQAIALQGSDEALMLLDALATRYRSKQRNIGAAAALAFQAAAEARGLSADELGDVVVPGFGFDADGVRDFTWDGGAARAELGVDLKLSWSDPESDKTLKGLPASAPDELRSEVKELGKLLREAAKGQAARLELALVRQRRWPLARWRELYENHPVLRAFATRLVWGVYGADGALLRCFRRYSNGLLADAAGGLEELPEAEASVGMVHPLELTAEAVAAWDAHLARFKVEPPFPQLARAVERLDPSHANRRELAVAKGRELGGGTFRSRAERRGWQRGSVVDAGGVAGYFKSFPGAGVEVTIETEGLYIGIDPMETVTLGVARFVRADTVKRGSYVYDDPQQGDERVLSFGAVPPVVYSETVGDLKAIAGIVGSAGGDSEADGA